jgi:thiol-disulfide isomerase/thioredoxin
MTIPADPQSAATFYRYDHPRIYPDILNDMIIRKADLGPGDFVTIPELSLVNGSRLVWPDVTDDRPLLLVFGSLTCPVTESAAPGLLQLYQEFGNDLRFVMVNVREAHPGARVPQPKTAAVKLANAAKLKARHHIPFDVAADDIDGTTHRLFGGRPNSAYVISSAGRILFRAQWANETAAIGRALADIVAGRPIARPSVSRTLPAMAKMIGFMGPVLRTAGRGATWDTWKVAPPLGAMMLMSGLFFFLPRRLRGTATMALAMGGLTAAAIYGIA